MRPHPIPNEALTDPTGDAQCISPPSQPRRQMFMI